MYTYMYTDFMSEKALQKIDILDLLSPSRLCSHNSHDCVTVSSTARRPLTLLFCTEMRAHLVLCDSASIVTASAPLGNSK